MDAVKFLQERNRMYESGAATPGIGLEDDYDPVIAVKVVEEWSAAHPRKTRQSEFLKHYPKADVLINGVISLCPKLIEGYNPSAGCYDTDCYDCKTEYWMQEVE